MQLVLVAKGARRSGKTWGRKAWLATAAFFMIKGLLWLTVPLIMYWLG